MVRGILVCRAGHVCMGLHVEREDAGPVWYMDDGRARVVQKKNFFENQIKQIIFPFSTMIYSVA